MKRLLCLFMLLALIPLGSMSEAPATLYLGSGGSEVVRLQNRLIELGFLKGTADGMYGPATLNCVVAAQTALKEQGHTLSVDGVFGPQTATLLYDDIVMRQYLDLRRGSSGQKVLTLQHRLYDLNYLEDRADGLFGSRTEDALTRLQETLVLGGATDVEANGVYDKATRDIMANDLSAYGIQAPEFFDDSRPMSLTSEYLYGRTAILLDAANDRVLFEKDADKHMFPASTTKIMTLLIAVEHGDLDRTITVPASARQVPKDSSLVPVYPGEQMTLRDLLYGLMVRSGNDAANAVAQIVSGSVDAFVDEMNQRAAGLGMTNTHYMNPHGYHHEGHYTTARDLATLSRHAMSNNFIVHIVACMEYTLPPTSLREKLVIRNNTELLQPFSPSYYEGAFGIKKGYTRAAGFCYAGAAARGDRLLIAVVMDCRDRYKAWADMARLFDFGFAQ
jgi:D-alanyl-D-alanine carboxypeptidase (penicillin-binding protein 5/6)